MQANTTAPLLQDADATAALRILKAGDTVLVQLKYIFAAITTP